MTGAALAAELRYAHVGAEGDIQTIYAAEAAKGIAAATNDEVTVTVYPASQLGGVAEMVDGVRMGSIQMGHHDFASLARLVPEVAVFNAPFIYRDGAHALAATDPATSPALQAINEKLVAAGRAHHRPHLSRRPPDLVQLPGQDARPISPASRSAPCRSSSGSRWSRASARSRRRSRWRNCRPR